ncbi:SWI/SNF and RSC complex subunit Ssr2 [Balamuthia mandrillaris]
MKSMGVTLVLLLAIVAAASAQLIVKKDVLNSEVLSSRDIVVTLTVFNVGKNTAYDVQLTDDNWPADKFDAVIGLSSVRWDKIAPGTNVSHSFVVHPTSRVANQWFRSYPATIRYRNTPKGEIISGFSSSLYSLPIRLSSESDILSRPHLKEWGVFSLLAVVSLLLPFGVWGYIQLNFEDGVPKKPHKKRA